MLFTNIGKRSRVRVQPPLQSRSPWPPKSRRHRSLPDDRSDDDPESGPEMHDRRLAGGGPLSASPRPTPKPLALSRLLFIRSRSYFPCPGCGAPGRFIPTEKLEKRKKGRQRRTDKTVKSFPSAACR